MQVALRERYALLPYLYTQFRDANETGAPIMRPMFYDFPDQPALHGLEHQFMFGPAILAVPVLDQAAQAVDVHFPAGEVFYTQTGRKLIRPSKTGVFSYPVTMDTIPWCGSAATRQCVRSMRPALTARARSVQKPVSGRCSLDVTSAMPMPS